MQFRGLFFEKDLVVWFVTLWSIWLRRNGVIFNSNELDVGEGIDLAKIRLWNWFYSFRGGTNMSFLDWCVTLVMYLKSS